MTARERMAGEHAGETQGPEVDAAVAVAAVLDAASLIEDWMAERHSIAPAVVFRPAIVAPQEPKP